MKSKVRGKVSSKWSNIQDDIQIVIDDKAMEMTTKKVKRNGPENFEEPLVSHRRPKRAAACSNFKQKSIRLSKGSCLIDVKQGHVVEEEALAIRLTKMAGQEDPRPIRSLVDFILHDENGVAQPFEMSEVGDLYITALVMPLDESSNKEKGVRCEVFGRIESWAISGYDEGSPVIWISTNLADYDCIKPANSYKKFFDYFFEKARACIEVFKKLSKSCGGNPDLSLDELIAGVVRSMSGSKFFPGGSPSKDFIISLGDFIYNQLIGLDETSMKTDVIFTGLPVLVALREECTVRELNKVLPKVSGGSLKINEGEKSDRFGLPSGVVDENEDEKLARLLQEEEYRKSMKRTCRPQSGSKKFYIKINEDEIANDYPLPAYYKTSLLEMDEYVFFANDTSICYPDELPRRMLHNWALYNSDSRLISLELLPMRSCTEADITIFGSGTMTEDDGSGFCVEDDSLQSSSGSSETANVDGIPIYLSAIKEWMIEIGSSMVFISLRTDMAWYRLGKPSKQYTPWYEPVLKTARLAISIITLLKEQSRVAKLSFADVIKKVSEFHKNHPAYISSNPAAVERYVVVHGQIILQQFAEYPDEMINKSAFVIGLSDKMEERHHTKLITKKKVIVTKQGNLNPRASVAPSLVSKKKMMQATTTKLINRIWGEYFSNYLPEDSKEGGHESKEEDDVEEQEQNEEDEIGDDVLVQDKIPKPHSTKKPHKSRANKAEIGWDGESIGQELR